MGGRGGFGTPPQISQLGPHRGDAIGPHVCLGMPLARVETTVAINALLDRLPDLHLDATAPEPVINDVAFRSPAALPVEFTPA